MSQEGRRMVLETGLVHEPASAGCIEWHTDFYSPQLDNTRTICVYLPPGYFADTARRYPVLYLQDGNNVFDTGTAFTGVDWGIDDAIASLSSRGLMEPIIAVGIFNTPGRMAEYSPSWDPRFEGGKGDAYLEFVVEEVKFFVDRTYRTRPERDSTAVAGSSMGGLISLWMAWRRPDVFSKVAALSSSLWWGGGWLTRWIASSAPPRPLPTVWLDVGTYEGWGMEDGVSSMVKAHRDLRDVLLAKGFVPGVDLFYYEDAGAPHSETAWASRAAMFLRCFFGDGRMPAPCEEGDGDR